MANLPSSRSRPALKKRFGQHHLRSAAACQKSLDFLDLEGREVLEIGGGGGVLTAALHSRARRVICWEVDPEWAFVLRSRLNAPAVEGESVSRARGGVEVVIGDALQIDWSRLPSELRVSGNLPYNVGTRIILDFLRWGTAERAAFLVQREVADRLLAGPGDSAYGGLSVAAAAQAYAEPLGHVGRSEFQPPPKVDGAFIGLLRRDPPVPIDQLDLFLRTVRVAFGSRRKTLRNALKTNWDRDLVDSVLDELGWSSKIRAEALGLDDFVALHRAVEGRSERPSIRTGEPTGSSAG